MKKTGILIGLAIIILILGFFTYQEIMKTDSILQNQAFDETSGDLIQSGQNTDVQEQQSLAEQDNDNQPDQAIGESTAQYSAVSENVEILEPLENSAFFVGDQLTLQLRLKTDGLVDFTLYFQGQTIFNIPDHDDPAYKFIINGQYIERQKIVVIASYEVDNEIKHEIVTRQILITPREQIISLQPNQETVLVEQGHSRRLTYKATFPSAIAIIGETDLVQVKIEDPNILSYDAATGYFKALAEGSTIVESSYRGQVAYSFFDVYVYREPATD